MQFNARHLRRSLFWRITSLFLICGTLLGLKVEAKPTSVSKRIEAVQKALKGSPSSTNEPYLSRIQWGNWGNWANWNNWNNWANWNNWNNWGNWLNL